MSAASGSKPARSTTVSETDRGCFPPPGAPGSLPSSGQEIDPAIVGRRLKTADPRDAGAIEIDARIVAEGLGIAPGNVEPRRLAGTITTLCERGTGDDAGLLRVTFHLGQRCLRLLVDAHGTVLQQSAPDQPSA